MDDESYKHYMRRCQIMLPLIENQFSKHIIKLSKNPESLFLEIILDDFIMVDILPGDDFNVLKNKIIKQIKAKMKDLVCNVCDESDILPMSCPKCFQLWCIDCYISRFRSGQGIVMCPNCKHCVGQKMKHENIQMCVEEIMTSFIENEY